MKVKKINSSSKKTDLIIKEAFASLMKEKLELKYITVTELVNRAGITRASFYTHYDNIYDLAQDIQDETLDFLLEGTEDFNSIENVYNYIDKIILHLKENDEFYSMILASNEPLFFMYKLEEIFNKKLSKFFINNSINETTIAFFTDGCINLFVRYFRNESNMSLDEINSFIKKMFLKIFK